jgi:uncharacterized protein YjiS (DUF1127 family)
MSDNCISTRSLLPFARQPGVPPWRLTSMRSQIKKWFSRVRSRRLLGKLDDRMLRDVGLTRSDVERECAKYFWQG